MEDGIGYCAPFRSLRLTPAPLLAAGARTAKPKRGYLWNKYLFILATHTIILLLQTKAERRRRVFWWRSFRLLADRKHIQQKNARFVNLASAFGVEDGARTHDLRNHISTTLSTSCSSNQRVHFKKGYKYVHNFCCLNKDIQKYVNNKIPDN